MPIFEYKCSSCGHLIEVLEQGKQVKKQTCPQCGNREMIKLLSGFAVGRSKISSNNSCHYCPEGPCDASSCATGQCPYSA